MSHAANHWPAPEGAPVTPAAPTPPPSRTRRHRTGLLAVLAVLLVVGLVWALGGFRTQRRISTETAGSTLDLGPVRVRVDTVTATEKPTGSDGWDVMVNGSCQVETGTDYDLVAGVNELMAVATNTAERTVGEQVQLVLDPGRSAARRGYLTPGLAPMACVFKTSFDKGFDPKDGVLVQFVDQEYLDTSVTQDQPERWWGSNSFHRFELPVQDLTTR